MCTHFANLFLKIRTMMIMKHSGPAKVSYLAPLASYLSLGRLFTCPKVKVQILHALTVSDMSVVW